MVNEPPKNLSENHLTAQAPESFSEWYTPAYRRTLAQFERVADLLDLDPRVRQRPAIRRFVIKRYFKVFYRVQDNPKSVEILRCWDARQGVEPPV